jgi:carbonic anhydrase
MSTEIIDAAAMNIAPQQPRHLIDGLNRFRRDVYPKQNGKWEELATEQHPSTLFITCADSRIDPSLITQAGPGELFVCRNPGNLVPPYGVEDGGVATTAEYAIDVLQVRHAIICGHSNCGAMSGLLEPEKVGTLPAVQAWLRHGAAARRIVDSVFSSGPDLLRILTEQNILSQMTNLRTYPAVAAALAAKRLTLHGWYYDIGNGMVFGWEESTGRFQPLVDVPGVQPGPKHVHL